MVTIKLTNKGSFNFLHNNNSKHKKCGFNDKSVYNYEVEIKVLPTDYILDVDLIDKYFTQTFGNNPKEMCMSCEEVALKALEDINNLCKKKDIMYLRVYISATAYSSFEAEFDATLGVLK